MSMLFGLSKRRTKEIFVLKFFSVVDYSGAVNFKVVDVLDFCVSTAKDQIDLVSWNYGAREWRRYDTFRNFQEAKNDTVNLSMYSGEKSVVSFGNALLNQKKSVAEKKYGTIEVTVCFDDMSDPEFCSSFFRGMAERERFDYGYASSFSEKQIKEGIHGVVVDMEQTDVETGRIFDVKNGYIKNIYRYNLLNTKQLEILGKQGCVIGEISRISHELQLLVLTEDNIRSVRNSVSFPLVDMRS